MWLYHSYMPGKRFVLFDFNLSRVASIVNKRLENFTGILQTDGYSSYNTQRKREDMVERDIKNVSVAERKAIRQQKSKPKLESIFEFIHKINAPPNSLFGAAVTYCKNQWADLIRYIDHGEAEISNCLIENQVRPLAIGKKNWM